VALLDENEADDLQLQHLDIRKIIKCTPTTTQDLELF
jgi:hypothetical protein